MSEAEQQLLDYTASHKWEQIEKMNWTTADVMEQMEKFHKNQTESNMPSVEQINASSYGKSIKANNKNDFHKAIGWGEGQKDLRKLILDKL